MPITLELLAPAGNAEIGIAAIDHGADAVYIGAPKFSARAQAGSTADDIARLIRHAHFWRAKVYVALNTILTDNELSEALIIIRKIHDLGADGLIIQDTGLLELDLPPIPLIASTQMHNDTPEKVRFLEAVGFQRVILARELSLEEIEDIRRHTHNIEMEAFVHGALCVSYSGQCYMSQAIANRSGNRGLCAQPCRSYYSLYDEKGHLLVKNQYLLSLKDMNRLEALPDLIAAGITSFKIEGRYKGIDYVKNVTAAYRMAIDRFISKNEGYIRTCSGTNTFTFEPDVERTFNRGYTSYFLSGKPEKIASLSTQKSLGKPIGGITHLGNNYFEMGNNDLQNGDGLCFFTRQGALAGCRVERVEKGKIIPGSMKSLEAGILLYRNADKAFEKILKQSTGGHRISVRMHFKQDDTRIWLSAEDEDGYVAEAVKEMAYEKPLKPVQAREQLEKQLNRTGNTPYRIEKLTIEPARPGFLTATILNGLRRDVLDRLTKIRQEMYSRHEIPLKPNNAPYPAKLLNFSANVFNKKARAFFERHGASVIEPAFESLADISGKTVMTTRYCIRYQLDLCPAHQKPEQTARQPLRLKDGHHTYRLVFDCKQCRMFVILEE
jgi:putative protease